MNRLLPILTILILLLVIWYAGAWALNAPQAAALMDPDAPHGRWALMQACWAMDRPVLPAPHQVLVSLWQSVFGYPLGSPRNFLLQAGYTAEEALTGLAVGFGLGLVLAVGIVHVRVLDRALMPWIVASQTVPVLAIAPMVIVALGNLGFTGLAPKAAIIGYLCFFPIVIGLVKGFSSPDAMQLDLMRTYDAQSLAVFVKLRWPVALAFLLPSLKVAAALAVTGAIIAELPAGAQYGLGARLLAGSYYGQTMMMWGALVMASLLALCLIGLVRLGEVGLAAARGGRL